MARRSDARARRRLFYVAGTLIVIAAGLASRRFPNLVPESLGKYPGDVLWALMVFLGWGCVFTRSSTGRLAALAFASCCAVEASQLYSAPWIDDLRSTTVGALALGRGFNPLDLVAYASGVAIGALGESVGRFLDFSAFDRR